MTEPPHVNICFHGIGTPKRDLEPGEANYWISRDQFSSILDELSAWPSVAISFDDGNDSDLEIGLPGLLERGLTATFFVLAGRLTDPGSLSPDDIGVLKAAGMAIGTHGMQHRPWRGMDSDTSKRELVDARDMIADIAGMKVDQAALPLGRYDRSLLADLRKLGYGAVHTSDRRIGRPGAWLQPRFSVRSEDDGHALRESILATRAPFRRLKLQAVGLVKRLR